MGRSAPPCLLLVLVLWSGITGGARCLRIRSLVVPESVGAGSLGVRLSCLFDPENEELYSVKWYKDEVEFFRFLPREKPVYQCFDIGDVQVDMGRSSNGTVFLVNLQRSAEGTYRCEVSADAPSFQSISSEKYMAVEDPPAVASSFAQLPRRTSNFSLRIVLLLLLGQFLCCG